MIALSKQQRDEIDRQPGVDLALPWPPSLARPVMTEGEARDATDQERRAALAMLREAIEVHDWIAHHYGVEGIRQPAQSGSTDNMPVRAYLVVTLRSRRWGTSRLARDRRLRWTRAALDER